MLHYKIKQLYGAESVEKLPPVSVVSSDGCIFIVFVRGVSAVIAE
jgi:hypothetical protein